MPFVDCKKKSQSDLRISPLLPGQQMQTLQGTPGCLHAVDFRRPHFVCRLLRLGTNRFLRTNVIQGGIISRPTEDSKVAAFRYQNCYILLDSIPHSDLVSGMRREFTRFWAQVNFESEIEQFHVLDAVPQSNWNVVSRNIAQEPTTLILRINDGQGPFNFLIFGPNWITGREFYIPDFSIPVGSYILQNVHRLETLRTWGLVPSILSQAALPHYHSTGGILSSCLSTSNAGYKLRLKELHPCLMTTFITQEKPL